MLIRRIASPLVLMALAITASADVITDAPSQWAASPSGRIHYRSWGRGRDAIVLIHGWMCDMSYFAPQVTHFANGMRVVAIDLPGHGLSDKPEIDYTQPFFAESVRRVLDDAHVKRAVLVGHSMGTQVARQFYRMYPERTLALVWLDGSFKAMITDQATIDTILGSLRGPGYPAAAARVVDGMLAVAPDSGYKAHIREVMLGTPQHVVASAATGMFDLKLWNDEPIKVPMLLIHAKSPLWTEEYEKYVRRIVPNVDYVVMDGVSHFLHTEKPAEINALIDAFLVKNRLLGQKLQAAVGKDAESRGRRAWRVIHRHDRPRDGSPPRTPAKVLLFFPKFTSNSRRAQRRRVLTCCRRTTRAMPYEERFTGTSRQRRSSRGCSCATQDSPRSFARRPAPHRHEARL